MDGSMGMGLGYSHPDNRRTGTDATSSLSLPVPGKGGGAAEVLEMWDYWRFPTSGKWTRQTPSRTKRRVRWEVKGMDLSSGKFLTVT